LEHPEVVYPELVRALHRERTPVGPLASRRILWTDCGWTTPRESAIGADAARLPRGSIPLPTARDAETLEACARLGAHRSLQAHHWRAFLLWAGNTYGSERTLPDGTRRSVRYAYVQLAEDPGEYEGSA